jgi:hypothetical protein
MGGKLIIGFLAALAVALVALATPVFTNLRGLVQETFSPSGILISEIPLATSTKAAALPVSAPKKVSPPPAPVVSVTPPLASPSQSPIPPASSSPAPVAPVIVPSSPPILVQAPVASGRILVSEIMVGADGNAKYEFVEFYNPTGQVIDLTGYSVRKKSSTGSESSLVAASRLESKSILPGRYFLLASSGGYDGAVPADVLWPASYSLAAKNNAIVVYNGSGEKVEEVAWTEIPVGNSLARAGWSGNQFNLTPNPTPQNSQSL